MNNMTKKEFYKKYGDVPVQFNYYNKYIFSYYGVIPDNKYVICLFGGNKEDIYNHVVEVHPTFNKYISLKDINFYCCYVFDNDTDNSIDGFLDDDIDIPSGFLTW